MSVYVDPLVNNGWRLGPNCHLFSDGIDELHKMAAAIGMKRAWFQDKASLQHYDLTKNRRVVAVRMGAIELDRKAAVMKWRELRSFAR
jgi:hypothetical protein